MSPCSLRSPDPDHSVFNGKDEGHVTRIRYQLPHIDLGKAALLDSRHLTTHPVATARTSEVEIQCYDGETRSRIYLLSYLTGLRRTEIASLTPVSFDLEGDPAKLTVEAQNSKHRKKDVLLLYPDLVRVLPWWLESIPADQPLFPRLAKRRT